MFKFLVISLLLLLSSSYNVNNNNIKSYKHNYIENQLKSIKKLSQLLIPILYTSSSINSNDKANAEILSNYNQMSGRDALEVRENIARISSKIPGFGPPDVTYPFYYEGQWNTKQSFNDIVIPGNNKRVISFNWPMFELIKVLRNEMKVLSFIRSYIKYENNIVLDRASTTTSEYSSLLNPVFPISSTWDPINPNVLTVNSFDGSIEEKRVTKRSVETFSPEESGITSDRPYPLALGYSEFSRIALTTAQGIQSAVPQVFAVRLLARLKGIPDSNGLINEIKGVERLYIYVQDSKNIFDTVDNKPTYIVKSTLTMNRI